MIADLRVIARSTLNGFIENKVEARHRRLVKAHLDAWYADVENATRNNPAELKEQFRSASVIFSERVVFNIKGNDFRLLVAINYHYQILLILWLGTHREYDKIDVEKVIYDKRRYTAASNSN